MSKTKLLILGPCESGKSAISNFLSEAFDTSSGTYHPTQGVRILEFDVPNLMVNGRHMKAEVELWDVSGDRKYEACWPAIAKDTSGIIFVYNPDQPNHDKELEKWHIHFAQSQSLRDFQSIIFAHQKSSNTTRDINELSSHFSRIPTITTNLDDDAENIRTDFNNFLASLLGAMSDKREQEELNIMNNR